MWPSSREGKYHFELGRPLAERLGYPADVLDRVPDGGVRVVRRGRLLLRPRRAERGRERDRPRQWLGHGRLLRRRSRSGRPGASSESTSPPSNSKRRGESPRKPAISQVEFREGRIEQLPAEEAELRLRDLERGDQSRAREGARLRRGVSGPAARRQARDRRHRQRAADEGERSSATRTSGPRASAARPSRTPTAKRSRALAFGSKRSATTPTSSSPIGRATRATSTG